MVGLLLGVATNFDIFFLHVCQEARELRVTDYQEQDQCSQEQERCAADRQAKLRRTRGNIQLNQLTNSACTLSIKLRISFNNFFPNASVVGFSKIIMLLLPSTENVEIYMLDRNYNQPSFGAPVNDVDCQRAFRNRTKHEEHCPILLEYVAQHNFGMNVNGTSMV